MTQSKRHRRTYPLQDSPFFRLKGKGQLAQLLRADVEVLLTIGRRENYRVWIEGGREIQAPKDQLAAVHKRIANLLKRIEVPDYVFSKRGRSHIDNAAQHCGPFPLVKTDISKFYPNTTRAMVFRVFRDDFQCATDIAHMLADICCFDKTHVPTGSQISGYVAFFAARPMLDEIKGLADEVQCVMSTFVDDIALSGAGADMPLLLRVRRLMRRAGYKTKSSKSRAYPWSAPKQLTGTVVTPEGLRLPNRQYKRMRETRQMLAAVPPGAQRDRLRSRLAGQLQAAEQVLEHPQSTKYWLRQGQT